MVFTSVIFLGLNTFPRIVGCFYKTPKLTHLVTLNLLTILFGQTIELRKKHFKLLFLSWIWFTFLLRSCYEARIKSLFIEKESNTQIDSLKEICEKNYTIFIQTNDQLIYRNILDLPSCKLSSDKFVHVEKPLDELLNSQFDSVAAFMYGQQYAWECEKLYKSNVENLHIIKEMVGVTAFCLYSRSGEISSSLVRKPIKSHIEQSGVLIQYERFIETLIRRKETYK